MQITSKSALSPELQLEVGIHYASGTTQHELQYVLGVLSEFGIHCEEMDYGSRLYRQLFRGTHGCTVQAGCKLGNSGVLVTITGEGCEVLGVPELVALLTLLDLSMSRLDVAVDYCPFTPLHLNSAYERGLVRTRVRRGGNSRRFMSSDEGDTFYLGSVNSDAMMRCYNQRGYTRTEMQLRRGHAKQFYAELLSRNVEQLQDLALGVIRNHVDFVDVTQPDTNVSRAPLLPFWSDFCAMFDKVKLAAKKPAASIRKYLEHVRKNACMFYVYVSALTKAGYQPEYLAAELFNHAESKLNPRHRLLLGMSPEVMSFI